LARLVALKGKEEFDLPANHHSVAIGSATDNDWVIAHEMISRRHAVLDFRDGSWMLSDAGSTNGTFINNQRISVPTVVRDGDQIRFGPVPYLFRGVAKTPAPRAGILSAAAALLLFAGTGFAAYRFVTNFSALEIASLNPAVTGATTASVGRTSNTYRPAPESAPTNPGMPMPVSTVSPLPVEHGVKPWLDSLNIYRKSVGLPQLADNPRFSPGCELHSRYLVTNYADQITRHEDMGALMHSEDPSKPGFSQEGLRAGRAGDVDEMWDPGGAAKPSWAVDDWMAAPFHRLSLLDFHLHSVGYGADCAKGICVATMDVHSDADLMLSEPRPLPKAVAYPPDGGTVAKTSFEGEWPDPLASCPDYSLPAGYPITLQLGPLVTPEVKEYSLTLGGSSTKSVEVCEIDANNFKSTDPDSQRLGREILRNYGAIVLIPRSPLKDGKYTVSITAADRPYSWSFNEGP
jgi:hypothetical protein